jgi:CheY-like chemotaxis protein
MNPKQLHILLADDDMDDCIFFKQALDELGITAQLTTMPDGEKLMQYLADESTVLPHMLFLDLNMPRKNGFECLIEIKLNKKLKQLPVVVFSTSFEQEAVNRLYQNGAQYFIRKPSGFSQYKKIIQQLITLISEGKITKPTMENFVFTVQDNLIS